MILLCISTIWIATVDLGQIAGHGLSFLAFCKVRPEKYEPQTIAGLRLIRDTIFL
jgi:hypothetical protein